MRLHLLKQAEERKVAAAAQRAVNDNAQTAYNNRELRRRRAYEDPEWYVKEILGLNLYAEQLDILYAVKEAAAANPENGEINQASVVGANGVGKDFTIGRAVVPWWIEVFEPAKAIVTAPTGRQIKDIVWQETRASFIGARYPLRGRMMDGATEWKVGPETFALGFSTDKPFNILGFHSPNLLVIVSEAHNFNETHMTQLRRLLPRVMLLSGNPLAEAGTFYLSHHDLRDAYRTIRITAWDSPNVKAGRIVVPGVVSRNDIATLATAWGVPFEKLEDLQETGKASAAFDSTVNGNFNASPDGLIPLSWIMRSKARIEEVSFDPKGEDVTAGIDVAGPGEDETDMWLRQGSRRLIAHRAWPDADPRGEIVAELRRYLPKLKVVNVDSAGIGYYLALHIRDQLGPLGVTVNLVNVGESPRDTTKYTNLKAELYWGLRLRFESSDVEGLFDNVTSAQLASIRYKLNAAGKVEIEKKEDLKKRIGKSPDRAEALMLCFSSEGLSSTAAGMREMEELEKRAQVGSNVQERDRLDDEGLSDSVFDRSF